MRSEAGIALPMTLAFTSTEPVIAANHMANAQARAIAESGVERTLWALTKGETDPAANGALIDPLPAPVPAPYDGSQLVNLGVGEFKVTVTNGPAVNERTIEAVGYVPNAAYPIAIKKLETVVTKVKTLDPPCAVCAGGEAPNGAATAIRVGGSASISAADTGSNYCNGVTPSAATYSAGTVATNGHPAITGPSGGSAMMTGVPQSNFTDFLFSDADMVMLKALAKANGTYYQGNQAWTSPPPNGIIFVDTPSGNLPSSISMATGARAGTGGSSSRAPLRSAATRR